MIARWCTALLLLTTSLQSVDDAAREVVLASRRPWLDRPMRAVTEGGRPLLVAAALAALAGGAAGRAMLLEAAVVLAPVNLVVEGLKYGTNRTRPDGTTRRRNSSFPSSHAANAFAVAALVGRRWRRTLAPLLSIASLVAFSRMYLDRHWLSDVFGGALIGGAGAWMLARAWAARKRASAAP